MNKYSICILQYRRKKSLLETTHSEVRAYLACPESSTFRMRNHYNGYQDTRFQRPNNEEDKKKKRRKRYLNPEEC